MNILKLALPFSIFLFLSPVAAKMKNDSGFLHLKISTTFKVEKEYSKSENKYRNLKPYIGPGLMIAYGFSAIIKTYLKGLFSR